ncbi:MAG TPA: YlxR family protein [Chloroflexota bacterium]
MPTKHVPLRTCVACRRVRPKREMVRLVRTPAGTVEVDLTGKRSGRGAYLCREEACWTVALKRPAILERAFKGPVAPADLQALREYAATLAPAVEQPRSEDVSAAG